MADLETQRRFLELMKQAGQSAAYRASMPDAQPPEEDRSWIMAALDYINRPYSALSGGIVGIQDALWAGADPSVIGENMWAGLSGREDFSGSDILGRIVDPYNEGRNEEAKRWGGLAWDLSVGNVYDPLSYLTFGSGKGATALQKAKRGLGVPIHGLTKWPGRTAAAQQSSKLWSLLRAQGRVPFTRLSIDIPLTPKLVNVPAAKALDWAGKTIGGSQAYKNVRKVVGGWRYLADKEYPGLAEFMAGRRLQDKEYYEGVVNQLHDMYKRYPKEALEWASHIQEAPELARAGQTVKLKIPVIETWDDLKKYMEEIRPWVEVPATAAKAHQQRMLHETAGLRQSISEWNDQAGGLRTIDVGTLEGALFGQNLPGVSMGRASQMWQPGELLTRIVDNADPNFSPEKLIQSYLVNEGELALDSQALPEFIGIFGVDEWKALQSKYDLPVEKVRVPVYQDVLVTDAAGKPILSQKGKLQYTRELVYDAQGTPKMRTKTTGGKGEFYQRLKRIAEKRHQTSQTKFGVDLASKLHGGETGNAVILYRHPGYSSLSPELSRIGGMGPLTKRQSVVMDILDKIDVWVKGGGNSLKMSEAIVSKDTALIDRIIKEAKLPDNKTTRTILESLHHNIWAGNLEPGRYQAHLKMFADDLFSDTVLPPHQRFAQKQQALKQLRSELEAEKAEILAGGWNPPETVMPSVPDVGDVTPAASARMYDELDEFGEPIGSAEELKELYAKTSDMPDDFGVIPPEATAEPAPMVDEDWWLQPTDQAAPLTQNERLEKIQQEIEAIDEALANPDLFDKSYFLKKLLEGQTRPTYSHRMRIEEIAGQDYFDDAARAAYAEGDKLLNDSLDQMMQRINKIDPNAKPPVENYLPHTLKKAKNPFEWVRRQRATKKKVDAFAQTRRTFWTNWGVDDIDVVEDIVKREIREEFGADIPGWGKKTGRGKDVHFLPRKHRNTLLELQLAGFPTPFEKNYPVLINDAVRTRMNWTYGYDLYEFARQNYAKFQPSADAIQAGRLVPIGYNVPFLGEGKNPFKDWFIPKELDSMLQGMLNLQHELTSDEAFRGILDFVSSVRRWWCGWTLIPFPAFHARNLGSDLLLAAQADVKPWTSTGRKSFAAAAELIGSDLPIAGKHIEKWDRLTAYMDVLKRAYPDADLDTLKHIMKREEIIEGGMRDVDLLMQGVQLSQKADTTLGKVAQEAMAWMPGRLDISQSKLLAKVGRAGQRVQDFTRSAVFLDILLQNSKIPGLKLQDAIDDAIKVTRKALFDYHDLTATERHLFKNLFPFYTFTAKNIPRQLEVLFTEPKRFAYLARAYNGLWNTDDEIFTKDNLPDWLKNAMGVPVRRKQIDGVDQYVVWSPTGWIPMTEINELAEMFRSPFKTGETQFDEAGKFFLSRLSPIFKEPVEQLMNYDSFTARKIDAGEIRDVFGISTNPRIAHLIRNIRLVTELDRLNPGGIFTELGKVRGHWTDERPHRREPSGAYRALRAATGMSLFDQKPLQEMRNESIRLSIEANKLQREVRRSYAQGQIKEAERLMGRVQEKQRGLINLRARVERYRQGRAREVQEQEKRKVGAKPEFGTRADGTQKGYGFFGEMPIKGGGIATEYSIGVNFDGKEVQIPSLVPTLTKSELNLMVNDIIPNKKPVPRDIVKKAVEHAKARMRQGKSPFAD